MNILILEDELDIADDIKERVESLGHQVMGPAPDCSAALELIWRERPDLALLDTHLGHQTCEAVLEECVQQGIPVLIATDRTLTEIPHFIGAHPRVEKPYEPDSLSEALVSISARIDPYQSA